MVLVIVFVDFQISDLFFGEPLTEFTSELWVTKLQSFHKLILPMF